LLRQRIEGWYLGQETGRAAARIIFGEVNTSAKLTISFPRSAGLIPAFYNHKPSAKGFGYRCDDNWPLYPFGFGLSYTTFAYGEPKLSAPNFQPDGHTTVSVEVTNTGRRYGYEIVQLYIRDRVSSVTRPVNELKSFRRVGLAPGASQLVTFDITAEDLAFYNARMERVAEPGDFDVMVGTSSGR
jgi:beta-glucosidase